MQRRQPRTCLTGRPLGRAVAVHLRRPSGQGPPPLQLNTGSACTLTRPAGAAVVPGRTMGRTRR